MRKYLAILIACQLLINSGLAFAHTAADAGDPHQEVHAHANVDLGDTHDSGDQDDDCHFHLCALTLNSMSQRNPANPATRSPRFSYRADNLATAPPVPPPNA